MSPDERPGKGAANPRRPRSGRGRPAKRPASDASAGERSILSNLPSTRPQRPSARRDAAKRAAAKQARSAPNKRPAAKDAGLIPSKRPATKDAGPIPSKRPATKDAGHPSIKRRRGAPKPPLAPPVPPQGFETEDEIEPGAPVQPPSRPEVAGALAELVGELAQTGIARSGRLLRDALGRLPGI